MAVTNTNKTVRQHFSFNWTSQQEKVEAPRLKAPSVKVKAEYKFWTEEQNSQIHLIEI